MGLHHGSPRFWAWGSAILVVCLFSWAAAARSQSARDSRWALLVVGISGDPDLQKEYLKELVELRDLLEGPLGFPRDRVIALFDDPKLDPVRIQYQSTRANLEKACQDIAARSTKEDLVFVFFEGHGDSDGKSYKLNLVGPDPSGAELAAMLYTFPAWRHIIVNATNCSGGSLEALAGKGKIVVSATRSGTEKNLTHLGKYFIEALAKNNADVDKNNRVSVFEAFSYAARKVEESYSRAGNMQTEHPVLSDNGEAQALTLADAGARPALLSRSAYLEASPLLLAERDGSPEMQALAKEAQALERQIDLLKSAKDEMSEADYYRRLEELLLKLAQAQTTLRKK
jgi:hypothetical protein